MLFLYQQYDTKIDTYSTSNQQLLTINSNIIIARTIDQQNKDKDKTGVSYTRLFHAPLDLKFYQYHLEIYRFMRPHILQLLEHIPKSYFENQQILDQILSIQQKQLLIYTNLNSGGDNIKQTSESPPLKILQVEYQKWQELNQTKTINMPFLIYLPNSKQLSYSQDQSFLEQKLDTSKPLKLEFTIALASYMKPEFLKLNRCVDSDFNVEPKQNNSQFNLQDCLQQFCQEEVLGVGDEWYCNKCKQHKRATKKMEIYKAPSILILHLKRFKSSRVYTYGNYFFQGGSSKINWLIDYPIENLDLNSFVISRKEDSTIDYRYDLFAVSNHYGGLGGGHYTAFARNPIFNQWYDFNDSSVHQVKKSSVVSESAYVLFYRRRDAQPCQFKK